MGAYKSQSTDPLSTENLVGIPELYRRCLAEEQKSTQLDMDKLKLILVKGLFFDRPLFEPPPTVDESSAINKETDLKIRRQLWEAGKYRLIRDFMGAQSTREGRLFMLAWWLNQEKICKPEDIIGIEELRRTAKRLFRCFSTADFHQADAVRAWIPYFDRLIKESRVAKDSSKLVKQGYDEKAVWAAWKKRSPIAAACEWLASRWGVDGATLANAYSRIYGGKLPRFLRAVPFHLP